jgi:uncharacterized protein (TIGR03067 family)
MRIRIVAAVLLLSLAGGMRAAGQPLDLDKFERAIEHKRLQGIWLPKYLVTENGVEPYPLQGRALAFMDSNFLRSEGQRIVLAGTFRIDPFKRALDLIVESRDPWDVETVAAGQKPPDKFECAYRVTGDLLTVCYDAAGKGRPGDLKTGPGRTVVVYERQKEAPAAPLPKAVADALKGAVSLDGTWNLLWMELSDEPRLRIGGDQAKRTTWVIDGARWVHREEGVPLVEMRAEFDPARPDRVVFTLKSVPGGPQSIDGDRWKGIVKREGDVLMVCLDASGREFPDRFAAKPDGGRALYVLVRAKEPPPARPRGGFGGPPTGDRVPVKGTDRP